MEVYSYGEGDDFVCFSFLLTTKIVCEYTSPNFFWMIFRCQNTPLLQVLAYGMSDVSAGEYDPTAGGWTQPGGSTDRFGVAYEEIKGTMDAALQAAQDYRDMRHRKRILVLESNNQVGPNVLLFSLQSCCNCILILFELRNSYRYRVRRRWPTQSSHMTSESVFILHLPGLNSFCYNYYKHIIRRLLSYYINMNSFNFCLLGPYQ